LRVRESTLRAKTGVLAAPASAESGAGAALQNARCLDTCVVVGLSGLGTWFGLLELQPLSLRRRFACTRMCVYYKGRLSAAVVVALGGLDMLFRLVWTNVSTVVIWEGRVRSPGQLGGIGAV